MGPSRTFQKLITLVIMILVAYAVPSVASPALRPQNRLKCSQTGTLVPPGRTLIDGELLPLRIGPLRLLPRIAVSRAALEHGLSGRTTPLKKHEGMLFVFQTENTLGFWMLRTYIPLQIAFISDDGRILEIQNMLPEKNPDSPGTIYQSKAPARYALEMAPNTLSQRDIKSCVTLGRE